MSKDMMVIQFYYKYEENVLGFREVLNPSQKYVASIMGMCLKAIIDDDMLLKISEPEKFFILSSYEYAFIARESFDKLKEFISEKKYDQPYVYKRNVLEYRISNIRNSIEAKKRIIEKCTNAIKKSEELENAFSKILEDVRDKMENMEDE